MWHTVDLLNRFLLVARVNYSLVVIPFCYNGNMLRLYDLDFILTCVLICLEYDIKNADDVRLHNLQYLKIEKIAFFLILQHDQIAM